SLADLVQPLTNMGGKQRSALVSISGGNRCEDGSVISRLQPRAFHVDTADEAHTGVDIVQRAYDFLVSGKSREAEMKILIELHELGNGACICFLDRVVDKARKIGNLLLGNLFDRSLNGTDFD